MDNAPKPESLTAQPANYPVPVQINQAVAENPAILRALRRLQASQEKGDHMSHYTKHSSHAQKHSSTW